MGVSYYITTTSDSHSFALRIDGKALATFSDELDEVAHRAGIKPLSDFVYVSREEALYYLEDEASSEEDSADDGPWYEPSEGLSVAGELIKSLDSVENDTVDREWVLEDLHGLQEALQDAQTRGLKWRLGIDI